MSKTFLALMCILVLGTTSAFPCAVCGFGQDGSQFAFILTTGILTFTPLILGGAVIFYLKKAYSRDASKSTNN